MLQTQRWTNILVLIEVLFCLRVANGCVEHIFSAMKLIKSDHQISLSEDRLDDLLLRIPVDAPPLAQWDASAAVQLWCKDKRHRQVSDTRAPPKPTTSLSKDGATTSEPYLFNLDDWETFIA